MTAPSILGPVVVDVGVVEEACLEMDVRSVEVAVVHVTQLAAGQTFTGRIKTKLREEDEYAPSTLPDLGSVTDAEPASVQIDCRGISYLRVDGLQSGVGGDVRFVALGGIIIA